MSKVRVLLFISAAAAAMIVVSCGTNSMNPDQTSLGFSDEQVTSLKNEAHRAFKDARTELYAKLPIYNGFIVTNKPVGAKDLSVSELAQVDTNAFGEKEKAIYDYLTTGSDAGLTNYLANTNNWGVGEMLPVLAWEAYTLGDDTKVKNFIKSNNLEPLINEISRKYKLEQHQKNLSLRVKSAAITAQTVNSCIDGDVFLSYTTDVGAFFIGLFSSTWKHGAVLDKVRESSIPVTSPNYERNNCFLTASDLCSTNAETGYREKTMAQCGYENVNKFMTEDATGVYRVNGWNATAARNGILKMQEQWGKPFGISGRNDMSSWYCTKVVWHTWNSQGYDIEQWNTGVRGAIAYATVTFRFWWGQTITIYIPYPTIELYKYKDDFITPDDIKDSGRVTHIAGNQS